MHWSEDSASLQGCFSVVLWGNGPSSNGLWTQASSLCALFTFCWHGWALLRSSGPRAPCVLFTCLLGTNVFSFFFSMCFLFSSSFCCLSCLCVIGTMIKKRIVFWLPLLIALSCSGFFFSVLAGKLVVRIYKMWGQCLLRSVSIDDQSDLSRACAIIDGSHNLYFPWWSI